MDELNKYIKQVSIKNFLNYKDSIIDNFDPNINLIIGKNGSGKTSFFRSIEFALTKNIKFSKLLFMRLSNDQTIKELTVSIQFNNDFNFMRKLTPLNEQYYVNNKSVNQAIYHHLLNYYSMNNNILIPQGKINQLIDSSDKLKDELTKFLISKNNVDELKELIDQIKDKFDYVNDLRSNLFSYLESLQEDRIVQEKISKIKDEIKLVQLVIQGKKTDSLEHRIKNKKDKYELIRKELNDLIEDKITKEKQLNDLKQAVEDEDIQNGLFNEENFKELTTKKVKLDLENDDLVKQLDEIRSEKLKLTEQISSLKEEIKSKQLALDQNHPNLKEIKEKERSKYKEIQLKKLEIDQLFLHDNDEQKEVRKAEIKKQIEVLQIELKELEENISKLTEQKNESIKEIEKFRLEQIEIDEIIDKESQAISRLTNERLNFETVRHKLCGEIDKNRDSLIKQQDKKRNFYSILGREILKGKENLDKVIQLFKNGTDEEKQIADNYYGWFIDNISFDKTFAIPIERTSKHYLLKHIVKDSRTANRLLKKFDEVKYDGTCEFVPLDLLKIKNIPIDDQSSVYQPLIKYIGHEKEIELAVKHCFTRSYICRSIEDVIRLNKKFTFVTLDGDLLLKNKSLNGGYINKQRLWIEQYNKYKICESFLVETTDKLNELKQKLQRHVDNLEQNSINLDESEQLKSRKHLEKFELRSKINRTEIELERCDQSIRSYKHMYKSKSSELEDLKSQLELIINFKKMSEPEKLNKISSLQTDLEKLNMEHCAINEICNEAKFEVKSLKIDLKENLLRQEIDLNERLKKCELELTILSTKSSSCQSTIKILEDSINQIMKRKNGSQVSSSSSQRSIDQMDLLEKKRQICQLEHTIEQIAYKEIELKFNLKNNLQMQRTYEDEINSYQNQIELMADKVNRYENLDSKTLVSKLDELQNELVEIGSQHTSKISNNLEEQQYLVIYNMLTNHRDLMTLAISLFKQEVTVERSLQTLSLFFVRFQQIFSKFKPNGRIQFQITIPQESIVNNNISDRFRLCDIWSSMNVSFEGEIPRKIDYCSGGQKTVFSLCYLLSILTLKQQPFLLIDETDQNLDESTCLKLGSILKTYFTHRIQFFFSSNRTYFANFADKIYRVVLEQNQSILNQVELDYVTSPELSRSSIQIPDLHSSQDTNRDSVNLRHTPKKRKTKH